MLFLIRVIIRYIPFFILHFLVAPRYEVILVAPTKYNTNQYMYITQLSPEGEVNSGGYTPRREASRYISTALHRP